MDRMGLLQVQIQYTIIWNHLVETYIFQNFEVRTLCSLTIQIFYMNHSYIARVISSLDLFREGKNGIHR